MLVLEENNAPSRSSIQILVRSADPALYKVVSMLGCKWEVPRFSSLYLEYFTP